MTQLCPHCSAELPESGDAYCPNCRAELPAQFPQEPQPTSEPATEPEAVQFASAIESESPEQQTARFWRTLLVITPAPRVTQALVAANVIVFVVMAASGVSPSNPTVEDMIHWGANYGPKTVDGEWWRLFTSMFLHIGFIHLLLNMWVLAMGGVVVERMLGRVGFLLMYLIAGLGGSVASLCWHSEVVSAGASGAIFGVYGALLGVLRRQRATIPLAVIKGLKNHGLSFLAYNLIFGLSQPNLDMAAHIGGLLTGFACGFVISRPFTPEGIASRAGQNVLAGVLGVAAIVTAIVLIPLARPSIGALDRDLQHCEEVERRAFDTYNSAYTKLQRGEISDSALADIVERDVLPEWRAARNQLASHQNLSGPAKEHVSAVLDYMRLREEGWALSVEAARQGDATKGQQAMEKHRLATEASKRFGTR